MAGGEGISEDSKQAVKKGKAKQPTQGSDVSVSPGSSSSLPNKSLLPIAELAPGRSLVALRNTLLLPIAALTPGQHINNWEIQGLVVSKSEIESYKSGDCCGIYFSFEMRDKAGGEIRVVCFESDVSRFFAKVVEGEEHVLTRGKLMKPKARFNRMNRACEIVLEYDSEIRRVTEDEENVSSNKSLVERVTEMQKGLEFCTSKLRELETEIKKGKIGNPAGTSIVKIESQGGVSGNQTQGEKKIEFPKIEFPVNIRKTSSNTARGAALGTLARVSPTE